MKYTDLDTSRKRTLLVNQQALMVALETLSKLTGTQMETWRDGIWEQCYAKVAALTDSDVDEVVQTLEENAQGFDSSGKIVIVEVKNHDD